MAKPQAGLAVLVVMLLPTMRYAFAALASPGRSIACLVADAGWTTAGVYVALFLASLVAEMAGCDRDDH
jgi:hypothetical protein